MQVISIAKCSNGTKLQFVIKIFVLSTFHLPLKSGCNGWIIPNQQIAYSSFVDFFFMFLFCLLFAMSLCASVYMCFVVTCWERADLMALVCGV